MTILRRLKEYLDDQQVRYEILTHREAFTAPEIARVLHVPGKEMASPISTGWKCMPIGLSRQTRRSCSRRERTGRR